MLDKFIEDKDQKNALAHEIATMSQKYAQEIAKGQMAINQVEAAHKSLFVVVGGPPWAGCAFWNVWELYYYPIYQLCLALLGIDIVIPLSSFGDHDACAHGYAWIGCDETYEKHRMRYTGISDV